MTEFKPEVAKAALILQSIVRAVEFADQQCGDFQASSDWLALIEAATNHAHFLLTGDHAGTEGVSS